MKEIMNKIINCNTHFEDDQIKAIKDVLKSIKEQPEEIKTVNCYAAMNKNEYDIENISFSNNKNKLVRRWGSFQDIVKTTIIFKTLIN